MSQPDVSVILLNWKRKENVARVASRLYATGLVRDMTIWNNNPEMIVRAGKARVINSSHNYRAYARFAAAMLAEGSTIVMQDDDLLFERADILALHEEYLRDPTRIYGFRGRNVVDGVYGAQAIWGECDIVLGQFMMFSKALLVSVYGRMLELSPMVRGDDIALSLLAGRKHWCRMALPRDLDPDQQEGLWKQPGHRELRQQMVDRILAARQDAPLASKHGV